jgi:F-type H+-transporting ATPase subunit delta
VTNRTAAIRYARALFDVAAKETLDLQAIERELADFAGLFDQHETLAKVLLNPAVPAPRKRSTVALLAARCGLSSVVGKLLAVLAERDRLVLVPDLLTAYRERLLEHQHVIRAVVTTATALSPDRERAIERSLAVATGRTVTLVTRVDPAIIGGLVARLGSTVYDGSVTRQLARMKERLIAEGR